MIKKSILSNQSILDVTLQHSGTIEQLFDVLKANNLTSLNVNPMPVFYIPSVVNKDIVDYYITENKQPASIKDTASINTNLVYTTNIEIANTENVNLIKS